MTQNELGEVLKQEYLYYVSGCIFCNPENVIVAETEHYRLIQDDFPIVEGHAMIVSRYHHGCLGEIPEEEFHEVESLRNIYLQKAQEAKPPPSVVLYEHGRAGHCVTIPSSQAVCHHFHLHLLPVKADIHPQLAKRFTSILFHRLSDVKELFERFGEYLLFMDHLGRGRFYVVDEDIESHLLRTLLCQELAVPERSDWEALQPKGGI